MAWVQADIDALKAAIASGKGVRSITFADQSMTFHSVDEMLKLLAYMEQDVNGGVTETNRNYRLAASNKGV